MVTVNFKETAGGFECKIINTDNLSKSKHELNITKGEWVIKENIEQDIFKYTFVECDNKKICSVSTWTEEGVANSKLIAASPDLLNALIHLYDSLPDGYTSECLPLVRKAIQKATALSF